MEGTIDAAVARRLLLEAGLEPGHEYVLNGKNALDLKLDGYNRAARFACWLVMRDLDQDAECAAALRRALVETPATHMRLHVLVHAVEAWLMADAEAISRSLSVSLTAVPPHPEGLLRPKRALVDLARRSRKRAIREALVPAPETTASVGPGYAMFLTEFVTHNWRPAVAAQRSESLGRLRRFLHRMSRRAPD